MNFLLSFAVFGLVSFFVFTVPGILTLSFTGRKFTHMEKLSFGTIIGLIDFTLFSYLLIILKLDILLVPTYMFVNIAGVKRAYKYFRQKEKHSKSKFALMAVVFGLGILGQLAIIAPSGTTTNGVLEFWSANGHDGMWHIAVMNALKVGGEIQNPIFAGERLVNYHFFSDVAPAMFSKYLYINDLDLYFKFFPLIQSTLLGASAYLLIKKVTKSIPAALWATFFTYFAGSFGYIVTYLRDKSIGGESIFWGTQIQSSLGNPPQIVSNFLVLTYLYFFYMLTKKATRPIYIICLFLLGTLALFKVYAALALVLPTILVGLWQIFRQRKFYFLSLGFFGGIFAALLYFPNSSAGATFLIFEPWWYIRAMIADTSRLNMVELEYRRQTYVFENNWKRVIFLEAQGLAVFLFGNLGMRFIGLLDFARFTIKSFSNYFNLLYISIIILSITFPLVFLQKGVATNTSQFLQYFLLLFGLLAGISTSHIISKLKFRVLKVWFAFVVVLLAVPTQVGLLYEFYTLDRDINKPRPALAKVSSYELEALAFIKKHTNKESVILTPPYNQHLDLKDTTPNIWDWFDTSYIAALSGRQTYFDDYEQLDIMGYKFEDRESTKIEIFENEDPANVKLLLDKTSADLIYYPKILAPKIDLSSLAYTRIFENSAVEIWRLTQ